MPISKIKATNFKSFNEIEIDLDHLNILIGANASGKSNFLQIFKFFTDITHHGLNNAISLQGDIEFLTNTTIGSSKNFSLEFVYKPEPFPMNWETPVMVNGVTLKRQIAHYFYEEIYKFTLTFSQDQRGFKIVEDKFIRKLKFCEASRLKKALETGDFNSGTMVFSNVEGTLTYEFIPETVLPGDEAIVSRLSDVSALINVMQPLSPQTLFMETSHFDILGPFENALRKIPVYDFDPRLPKKAVPVTGKADLEEDGSNLTIILKNILEDEEKTRKLSNLVKYLLPFVDSLRVEKSVDRHLLFSLEEVYNQHVPLPASAVSDGTINIIALIVALYFEEKPVIVIEEPERNIHPFLISKVVEMLEEASAQKQIIVTTHNPEIVKYAQLKDVLLISRDQAGFSQISRPAQKDEIKTFLENEIGIDQLFTQDLLGV